MPTPRARPGGCDGQIADGDSHHEQSHEAPELGLAVGHDVGGGNTGKRALPADPREQERPPARTQREGQEQRGGHERAVCAPRCSAVVVHRHPRRPGQFVEQHVQRDPVPLGEPVERFQMPELRGTPFGLTVAEENPPAGWVVHSHLPDRHLRPNRWALPRRHCGPVDLSFIHKLTRIVDCRSISQLSRLTDRQHRRHRPDWSGRGADPRRVPRPSVRRSGVRENPSGQGRYCVVHRARHRRR